MMRMDVTTNEDGTFSFQVDTNESNEELTEEEVELVFRSLEVLTQVWRVHLAEQLQKVAEDAAKMRGGFGGPVITAPA